MVWNFKGIFTISRKNGNKAVDKRLFWIFFLIVLWAIWTLWFNKGVEYIKKWRDLTNPPYETKQRKVPDYIVEDFLLKQFDLNGALKYELVADELIELSLKDLTVMRAPVLKLFQDTKVRWQFSSKNGRIYPKDDQVEFYRDVVIQAFHGLTEQQQWTLKTEYLNYLPKREQVLTDRPLYISHPQIQLSAVGMIAKLDQGKLKLLQQVIGEYRRIGVE